MENELLRITSRSNPTVIRAASLQEKKFREKEGLFLLEGWKLVGEAISSHVPLTQIFIEDGKEAQMRERLSRAGDIGDAKVILLSRECLEKISSEKSPEGVIAVAKYLDFFKSCIKISSRDLPEGSRALCLYSVRDPGNIGAVIRSAVAFGTDTLILSDDCADLYNTKTLRAAMGCLFKLRIFRVSDVAESIRVLREECHRRVYAAELNERSRSVRDITVRRDDVYIIGNEGHGIPAEISALCDGGVYIPIENGVESLNASVAAAIFLWEQGKREK